MDDEKHYICAALIRTVDNALPLIGACGSIILSTSIVPSKGFGNWSIYSATKAAVRSFAPTWASDLKGRDMRVNAVSPGVNQTTVHNRPGTTKEEVHGFCGFTASITPLGRTGHDDEVAEVVAFRAWDDGSFVNGSEFFIDGGLAQIRRHLGAPSAPPVPIRGCIRPMSDDTSRPRNAG